MIHALLAAILAVLVYALIWRPWRAYRRHLRDMRRAHEMLYPKAPEKLAHSEPFWVFPIFVCLVMGVLVATFIP